MQKIVLSILMMGSVLHAMEKKNESPLNGMTVYQIPSLNGEGSSPYYVNDVLDPDSDKKLKIVKASTPTMMPDLGQFFCQRNLKRTLDEPNFTSSILATSLGPQKNSAGIAYATGDGALTVLNYLAAHPEDQHIRAVVLESPVASGNSAIMNAFENSVLSPITCMPFSYYWLPYIAMATYRGYRPGGQQPLLSANSIRKDIPVIIAYGENCPEPLPLSAQSIYYQLRQSGHDCTYLLPISGSGRLNIFLNNPEPQKMVTQILESKLLGEITANYTTQQPNPNKFKKQYDVLERREIVHFWLEKCIGVGILATTLKLGIYFFKR